MSIQEHLEKLKTIQLNILKFVDNQDHDAEEFHNLISFLNEKIKENEHIFQSMLHLISIISKNHHQNPKFYDNITGILNNFKEEIKQRFSNFEIFNIFRSSKIILLFLFENNILIPDEYIAEKISTKKYVDRSYPHFFYPEFKPFFDSTFSNKIKEEISNFTDDNEESFKQQRKIGQNENIVCQLIRNDSLNEFISFCSRNRIRFNSKVDYSIFETNSFLYGKQPTIIEYTVFFGSIQIFKYLISNEIRLTPSLWIYSIHGNNSEIIHLLEENNLSPQDKIGLQIYDEPYEKCLIESIKCHHNDFAIYILNNFMKSKENFLEQFSKLNIKYHNYEGYPDDCQNAASLYMFCKIDEPFFVDFLLKNGNIDINIDNILILFCLNEIFICLF